ncbi:4-(cytidine 5'-diphospho)-2-C-methyl-D-erythritol kinase [Bradyrhizobium sp. LHD-71]|uniref:4-(cytidine 5'-diphospho)-2-C-methyl-D-erythritol kinase n=1 Tax=Bradyrhizobium sp. LHD-71 TaxID=3072141 RepID=UPI00280FF78D|nr:4-(cytidine 5'-diphospho)-2-C-methyl-D-erythritol kinase [Bradyrhizobium sp. LHD-71]MDQ8730790.1 4-(cytidine 5'-diphospho)-2-C-methyl-D-erythritol kinase [Bradyrhizobium sp. LHD-71]
MTVLKERARAKVNLTLHVLGRRGDGYHDLESLVAFADCADALTFSEGESFSLAVTGPRAADCGDLTDNLVAKAERLLAERVPKLKSGAFVLDKHLPAAAGIGGGSADAAATLRLLAGANDIARDDVRVIAAAQAAGADVPVCLLSSACMMRGAGERVTPLPLPRLPCVLVNPGVPVPTKDVFAAIGLKAGETFTPPSGATADIAWPTASSPPTAWLAAIKSGRNDLEPVAVKIQPVIAEVLALLGSAKGCTLSRMSGSGATCFGLFDTDASAATAAASLKSAHPTWWVEASGLS